MSINSLKNFTIWKQNVRYMNYNFATPVTAVGEFNSTIAKVVQQ